MALSFISFSNDILLKESMAMIENISNTIYNKTMKFLIIFNFLILFLSCSKEYHLTSKNGIYFLNELYAEMDNSEEVSWHVGLKREIEISKGIRFYISVPKLEGDSINLLNKKYGVDSWLYRFRKIERGAKKDLGLYSISFNNISRNTKNFSVNLFYQAAAISKLFRNFHCPAFNHRFKIENYGISPRPNSDASSIYLRQVETVRAQVGQLRFSPMILPGGLNLAGKYIVDMAFYNSNKKQRFSEWFPINGVLDIQTELKKTVASCNGIKEENKPLPESRLPNLRDFEIK